MYKKKRECIENNLGTEPVPLLASVTKSKISEVSDLLTKFIPDALSVHLHM